MTVGVITYTDQHADPTLLRVCREHLRHSFDGEIVCCSLQPLDFGRNIVVEGQRGYVTMMRQILAALEASTAEYVYFCEHDVLYNSTAFGFVPPSDTVFYYNDNVWRWWIGDDHAVRHHRMLPLSAMCCCRELALRFYRQRWQAMLQAGLDQFQSREPALARRWGYEPGTKQRRRGGLTDDSFDVWSSTVPIIDIRHRGAFSPPKVRLSEFKHAPQGWEERPVSAIPGWENIHEVMGP